jgi:hypothetical protein
MYGNTKYEKKTSIFKTSGFFELYSIVMVSRNTRKSRKSRNTRKSRKSKKRGGGTGFSKSNPPEIKKEKSISQSKPKKVSFTEQIVSHEYSDDSRLSDEFYRPDKEQISKNKKKRIVKTPLEKRIIKTAKNTAKQRYNNRQATIDKEVQYNKYIEQLRLEKLQRKGM